MREQLLAEGINMKFHKALTALRHYVFILPSWPWLSQGLMTLE